VSILKLKDYNIKEKLSKCKYGILQAMKDFVILLKHTSEEPKELF
jgi:hypothetical protein